MSETEKAVVAWLALFVGLWVGYLFGEAVGQVRGYRRALRAWRDER